MLQSIIPTSANLKDASIAVGLGMVAGIAAGTVVCAGVTLITRNPSLGIRMGLAAIEFAGPTACIASLMKSDDRKRDQTISKAVAEAMAAKTNS